MERVILDPKIAESVDPLGVAEDLSPEAIAQRVAERQLEDEFVEAMRQWDTAKRIKARRRSLGRNGFATRRMAVPSKHAKHRTRNSR